MKFCKENEINFIAAKVGDRFVLELMRQEGYSFGGEQSGHIIIPRYATTGDGQLTAIALLSLIKRSGKKLSELMAMIRAEFGAQYMAENSYTFDADRKEGLQQRIFAEKELPDFAGYAIKNISYMDGCKVYFENGGWVVIRFSGTEPLLRVFCEMPTQWEADSICDCVKKYFAI